MENLGVFRVVEDYKGVFNCYWTPPNSDKEHPLSVTMTKKFDGNYHIYLRDSSATAPNHLAQEAFLDYAKQEAREILKAWREGEIIRTDPRTLTGEALLQHIAQMLHIVFDKLDK